MKWLVITGGSRGIGLAAVREFASNGFKVLNISRRDCPQPDVRQVNADLADIDWIDRHGPDILASLAGADRICLVHNAGLLGSGTVDQLDGRELAHALQVNVVASQQLNRLLLPKLGAGSSILYVGSTLSEKAVPGACAYVTAKHAVIGLMRASCQDLAGRAIHTACICPGFTDTEMLRDHVGGSEEILGSIAAGVTYGRLIEPGEIARTLFFCAENPVINGAVIHANLGQVER